MPGFSEKKKILITVRTYPTPAKKGVEVSCTGGITENGKWIRLFPLPYRFLKPDKRFSKYQWIEASVKKATDSRPESYNVDCDSIKILSPPISTKNNWQQRKDIVRTWQRKLRKRPRRTQPIRIYLLGLWLRLLLGGR